MTPAPLAVCDLVRIKGDPDAGSLRLVRLKAKSYAGCTGTVIALLTDDLVHVAIQGARSPVGRPVVLITTRANVDIITPQKAAA